MGAKAISQGQISKSIFDNSKFTISILVAAVLVAFGGGFGNGFLNLDDPMYVFHNPLVITPNFANLIRLLKVECCSNFHPLTMTSLWLNSFLFGPNATSFIITNTIIHILNTILVFIFTRKLSRGDNFVSFFTALLWGVHPMHVESVTWISERKDVLYACFFLLSCIQYIKFLENEKVKFFIYSLLLFILACLAKGMAVSLPMVLILLDYWYDKKWFSYNKIVQKIPFFIIALLFGLLAVQIQAGGDWGGRIEKLTEIKSSTIIGSIPFLQRIGFGFYGFLVYIIKLFVPLNQRCFYAYPSPEHVYDLQYVAAPFAAFILLAFAVKMYGSRKEIFFGIMFFFFTIVSTLQFIPVGIAILAERYSYIPYFGLIFMVVYWLKGKFKKKKLAVFLGIFAVIFIFLSYRQTQTYKDTGSLFLNACKYEPRSGFVNATLVGYYGQTGDYEHAILYGETAVKNGVISWKLYRDLGKSYYFAGNFSKALDVWKMATSLVPESDKTGLYYDKALMERARKDFKQSLEDFDSSVKYMDKDLLSPKANSPIYYDVAITERLAGNYDESLIALDNVMKLDSTKFESMLKEKAAIEIVAKKWDLLQKDCTIMINLNIVKDTAYCNRGSARLFLGDREGAIADWNEALKINPGIINIKDMLSRFGTK